MASSDDLFQNTEAPAGEPGAGAPPVGAAPAEGTAPGEGAAPARKRAPRRATKKASAPAPAETAAATPAEPTATGRPTAAGEGSELGDSGASVSPARKTVKKAAKKTAKKAATRRGAKKTAEAMPPPEETVAERAPAEEDAAEPAAATAARPTAARSTAARSTADRSGEPLLEPVGSEVPPVLAPWEELPEAQADEDEDEDGTQAEETARSSSAPSFGVLFQPPEPPAAPTRRRAAKRAAATPEPAAPEADRADQDRQADHAAESGPEDESESETGEGGRRRRRRGGKGRRGRGGSDADEARDEIGETPEGDGAAAEESGEAAETEGGEGEGGEGEGGTSRRRTRRRRRGGSASEGEDTAGVVTRVREPRKERDEPTSLKGSTRLEAKKQRRREGREAGRRRTIITEAEFLARRESVERTMVVRNRDGRTQIGVLEDGVLVEHYVSRETNASMAGNVYLGRVQNVLPSMEAAFIDIGKGRNAVLYAGEVNWDAAGLENNQPKRIENALKSGDSVLVQVTKDPMGHKGARLTSQISLPGRYLVYVPEGSMTGISRKLPDTERARLKQILKEVVPESAGVIVRTAAEGASEEELRADVERLTKTWEAIKAKAEGRSGGKGKGGNAPALVHGEPDLTVRVIRDVFNEDFNSLVVAGEQAWGEVSEYIGDVAPDLRERLQKWTSEEDLFTHYRVDEQLAKAMDRKVWLPSGGSLVIDRTEAMTVVDVNTGKFVGSGGNLEETVTKNNIEAAEEIVRQLRLRDIGGIIVIDFIDMVLESNRDLVVRRLLECLGRDRTKHQVAEVTSLGLVQMTRKRVGSGLIEIFSETCEHCSGRGIIVHTDPVDKPASDSGQGGSGGSGGGPARSKSRRGKGGQEQPREQAPQPVHSGPTPAQIAAAAHAAALKSTHIDQGGDGDGQPLPPHEPAPERAAEPQTPERVEAPPAPERVAEAPAAQEPAAQAPAAEQPAAPPKRRRRGRVMAPAGPPRPLAGEHDGPGAEAAEPQDS